MGGRVAKLLVALALVAVVAGAAITGSLLTSSGAGSEATHRPGTVAVFLVVACALTTVSLGLRWVRWQFLIRRSGARVHTRDGAKLYAATLPAIATPFYVGELTRAAVLARRHPGRGWVFAMVWAIERLGDLMAVVTWWAALDHQVGLVPVCLVAWAAAHFALAALVGGGDHHVGSPATVALTMALSLLAWGAPGLALVVVAHGFGPAHTLGPLFYRSTVLGGLTGSPLGVGVTGVLLIHGLEHAGMVTRSATLAVATFRAGTSWFALTLGLAALARWHRVVLERPPVASARAHFNAIAGDYATEIPDHIRRRLVDRKVAVISSAGRAVAPRQAGFELGCGQGWYTSAMVAGGFAMVACDTSVAQASFARAQGLTALTVGDGAHLPYADGAFGFAYAINVIHHITDAPARARTLEEIVRVLRPGGVFVLHEINTTNPLFRFYMGYVFPLLHRIDEGTELFIRPRRLPPVSGGRWDTDIEYMTFLPEFAPAGVVRLLGPLERRLEQSRLRTWSAHYAARLVKDGGHDGVQDGAA